MPTDAPAKAQRVLTQPQCPSAYRGTPLVLGLPPALILTIQGLGCVQSHCRLDGAGHAGPVFSQSVNSVSFQKPFAPNRYVLMAAKVDRGRDNEHDSRITQKIQFCDAVPCNQGLI